MHDAVKVLSMQVARKPHLLRVSFLSVYATEKALLYVSLVVLTEEMTGCGLPLSRLCWHVVLHSVLSCGLRPSYHDLHGAHAVNHSSCDCCFRGSLQGWELRDQHGCALNGSQHLG